ncbi:MAG: citrate (Si)-synthase [Planctomycetota bacterium]
MKVRERLKNIIPQWRERINKLIKEYGNVKVDESTISKIYGGMRDLKSLVTDISYVDPQEGIRIRGFTIPELLSKLPKRDRDELPLVGGLYYLLLTGELPSLEDAEEIEAEWKRREHVPEYVFDVLRATPRDTHSMTMFAIAVLTLQRESVFAKRYVEGMKKEEYWEPMLEDSLSLTAKLPIIAAYIYRMKYKGDYEIAPAPQLDLGGNFAHLLGVPQKEYKEIMRLYYLLYCDHESGNVSAHTTHLVASALSDIYYSYAAGLCGLAGPLHGLAAQESLRWILEVRKKFNGCPTREQLEQLVWETVNLGHVIPGYGHAVLRKTDPRFTAQFEFALKYLPDDELFQIAKLVYEVVPEVLKKHGKVKDPWPNVDSLMGVLQYHYGIREFDFYTLIFGVSRALGVTANAIWSRALGLPIERPKSLTTTMLEEIARQSRVG